MTQGKAWRDGRNATKKRNSKQVREKRNPVKKYKHKKVQIIEDDMDEEIKAFLRG